MFCTLSSLPIPPKPKRVNWRRPEWWWTFFALVRRGDDSMFRPPLLDTPSCKAANYWTFRGWKWPRKWHFASITASFFFCAGRSDCSFIYFFARHSLKTEFAAITLYARIRSLFLYGQLRSTHARGHGSATQKKVSTGIRPSETGALNCLRK